MVGQAGEDRCQAAPVELSRGHPISADLVDPVLVFYLRHVLPMLLEDLNPPVSLAVIGIEERKVQVSKVEFGKEKIIKCGSCPCWPSLLLRQGTFHHVKKFSLHEGGLNSVLEDLCARVVLRRRWYRWFEITEKFAPVLMARCQGLPRWDHPLQVELPRIGVGKVLSGSPASSARSTEPAGCPTRRAVQKQP